MLKLTFRVAVTCLLAAACVSPAAAGHHHRRYAYATVYNPYNLYNPSFGVAWGYNPWVIVQPVAPPVAEPAPPANPGDEPGIEAAAHHHAAARQAQEDFLADEDQLLGRAMDTLEEIRAIRESLHADAPADEMPEPTQSDDLGDGQTPSQPE